jgi:hypothetical protein
MQPVPRVAACGFPPALPTRSGDDGLFSPTAAMAIPQPGGAGPFLDVGREAASHGRARDAESAFIVACRLQAQAGGDPARLADIQAELARHYVDTARRNGPGADNDVILARARQLLDDALPDGMFAGPSAAKAREVRAELASLEATAMNAPGEAPQDPSLQAAMRPEEQPDAAAPARGVLAATLVAQDAELAQLDADLQRLRAQAQSVTHHPAAFQRRAEAARARRDACGDRACLLRWYAARRSELIGEF